MANRFLVLILAMATQGCGNSSPGPARPDLLAEIDQVLNGTLPCSGVAEHNRTGNCQIISVGFTPKQGTAKSIGQRVLILDRGMRLPAYTRYKSRVLDDLEADAQGEYRSVARSVQLYRGRHKITSEILDEKYPHTPARFLNAVEEDVARIFPDINEALGHGDLIFGTLADLNPEAEFVIAQDPPIPTRLVCDFGGDNISARNAEEYFRTSSDSLKRQIVKNAISFVNISSGIDAEVIRNIQSNCESPVLLKTSIPAFLRIVKQSFYENLFSMKGVVFVQAGVSSSSDINESDARYTTDCFQHPNRIRVGYVSILEDQIPREGIKQLDLLGATQAPAAACLDVFINSGTSPKRPYAEGSHPYQMTIDGIGSSSMLRPFCTSWAAPFMLSYLIHTKTNLSSLLGSHLILDPFRHSQFETFAFNRNRNHENN